jgi:hypothetical protein
MSWDQGIALREELPTSFIDLMERKRLEFFGEPGKVEYIVWFGLGEEFDVDFGDSKGLHVAAPISLLRRLR